MVSSMELYKYNICVMCVLYSKIVVLNVFMEILCIIVDVIDITEFHTYIFCELISMVELHALWHGSTLFAVVTSSLRPNILISNFKEQLAAGKFV